jgi:hypothetical protein
MTGGENFGFDWGHLHFPAIFLIIFGFDFSPNLIEKLCIQADYPPQHFFLNAISEFPKNKTYSLVMMSKAFHIRYKSISKRSFHQQFFSDSHSRLFQISNPIKKFSFMKLQIQFKIISKFGFFSSI